MAKEGVTQHSTDSGSPSQYRTSGMLVSPVVGPQKPLSSLSHKSQVAEGCLTSRVHNWKGTFRETEELWESRGEKNKPFSGCLPEREICSPIAFKALSSPPIFLYSGHKSSPIHTDEDMEMFGLGKGGQWGTWEMRPRNWDDKRAHEHCADKIARSEAVQKHKKRRLEEGKLGGRTTYDSKGQGRDRTLEPMILTQDFTMLLKRKCIATVFLEIDLLMCTWHIRKCK